MSIELPVRIQIRADRPAGVIRAFLAVDGEEPILLSTLAISFADDDNQLFQDWHKALSDHLARVVKEITGRQDVEMHTVDPRGNWG